MDTTYIKMSDCPEIQGAYQYVPSFNPSIFVCEKKKHIANSSTFTTTGIPNGYIWLPRQDDLQKIYTTFVANELGHTVPDDKIAFINFSEWLKVQYRPSEYTNVPTNNFPSGDQLWLAFCMSELYQKTWNGDNWE